MRLFKLGIVVFILGCALLFSVTPALAYEGSVELGISPLLPNGFGVQFEMGLGDTSSLFARYATGDNIFTEDSTLKIITIGTKFYSSEALNGFYFGDSFSFYTAESTEWDESYTYIGVDVLMGYRWVFGEDGGFSLEAGGQVGFFTDYDSMFGVELGLILALGYTW